MRTNSRKIIVTGPMRSGTTMLAGDISANLLRITPMPEINPLLDLSEVVEKWIRHQDDSEYLAWLPSKDADRLLIKFATDLLFHPDDSWQLCKHPGLVLAPHSLKLLLSEGFSILLIYRDPLDIMSSCLEVLPRQGYGHDEDFYITATWRAFETVLELLDCKSYYENLFIVRYEEYVCNSPRALEDIRRWLSLTPTPESTAAVGFTPPIDNLNPYYTPLMGKRARTTQIGRAESDLPRDKSAEYKALFSGIRATLGYE